VTAEGVPRALGRYELLQVLGRGTSAVVYKARDPALDRTVALKAVGSAPLVEAERQAFEDRFLAEARLAARLSHPGIARIHDAGKDGTTGALFVVLELVEGRPLAELLAPGQAMPLDEALLLTARVAEALHHAHALGLVHRDVRPANIMVTPSGEPKLTDFGVARLESARITVTSARQAFGEPLYMSPEQAVGERADARSDIFSLGAVAYRILTGRDAFAADEPFKVLGRVIHDNALPPSQSTPGLPAGVDQLVALALAKPRKDRYADAGSMAEDAEDIRAGRAPRHAAARPVGSGTGQFLRDAALPGAATAAGAHSVGAGEQTNVHRRSMLRGAVGAAALMLVAGLELLRRGSDARGTPAPAGPSGDRTTTEAPPTSATDGGGGAGLPSLNDPVPGDPAHLVFDLQHSLRRATLRVTVDDVTVLDRSVAGAPRRSFLGLKAHQGRVRESFDVPPGRRRVRVTVRWEDSERSESISGNFRPATTRTLSVRLGGVLKDLSLEWR